MPSPNFYDNIAAVPNSRALLAEFTQQSLPLYTTYSVEKNIPYGDSPRETLDWFYAPQPSGDVLIFIHGGYWQACSKEDFAFIAEPPLSLGIDTVLIEYDLAPKVTMTDICRQVGAALDRIAQRLNASGQRGQVFLSGHSAGGHLTAHWQSHPVVSAALPISGIFDLAPITQSRFNDKLQLSQQEIAEFSPILQLPDPAKQHAVFYGAAELPELVFQSLDYHAHLAEHRILADVVGVENSNHFTVLPALFAKNGALIRWMAEHRSA